ncbi:MAG: class I SAM-dependent methyltransferase [Nitrospirae bacterium]|nr:class I SAM-dependent methyltransferase [Nitrospirota bacterium]MBF0591164.1 class I SAM-dependent methyltransferase [Nitrospirota bacterium]
MGILISSVYEDKDSCYLCPVCNVEVRDVCYEYTEGEKPGDCKERLRIYRCGQCGFLFARPTVENSQMDSIDDAELFNSPLLKKLYEKLIVGREIFHARKILGKKPSSLLDVGCGTGWIAKIWKEHGFDVVGLEPSSSRGDVARQRYGIKIIPDRIENLGIEKKYDVIVMRHVIEHFREPYEVLVKLRSLLREGGIIIITVPNIDCVGRILFGARWSWILPYHCNFFNPQTLSQILDRAGFSILKSYQVPSPLWYPESLGRLIPDINVIESKIFRNNPAALMLPFMPVVLLGYVTHYSDNITVVGKSKES